MLEQSRVKATRALQLPLSLLSTKDEFRAELGQIAAIVENANPEDPRMLAVEVEAHKVGMFLSFASAERGEEEDC